MTPAGLPHSEIPGSTAVCAYPRLIAACHVLLRFPEPRHPPYALTCLTSISGFPQNAHYNLPWQGLRPRHPQQGRAVWRPSRGGAPCTLIVARSFAEGEALRSNRGCGGTRSPACSSFRVLRKSRYPLRLTTSSLPTSESTRSCMD